MESGAMREIPLTQGKVAIVDDADFERLSAFNWCVNGRGYAETWMKTKTVRMHRFIMGNDNPGNVDHIDGNPLNNTRSNLRFCTQAQNSRNGKVHKDNPSGYKGVSWDRFRGKWGACIRVDGHKKFLGRFDSAEEAAVAYNVAALEFYGEFAWLNTIRENA